MKTALIRRELLRLALIRHWIQGTPREGISALDSTSPITGGAFSVFKIFSSEFLFRPSEGGLNSITSNCFCSSFCLIKDGVQERVTLNLRSLPFSESKERIREASAAFSSITRILVAGFFRGLSGLLIIKNSLRHQLLRRFYNTCTQPVNSPLYFLSISRFCGVQESSCQEDLFFTVSQNNRYFDSFSVRSFKSQHTVS